MYPIVRMFLAFAMQAGRPRLLPVDTLVSHVRCWPWDIDMFLELNNGRTLTLYDLGRLPFAMRTGLVTAMRREHWGFATLGVSVRYRHPVRVFDRLTMLTSVLGWDERFFYLDQSLWRGAECCNQMLMRCVVTSRAGLVPTERVAEAIGIKPTSPRLPEWVTAWAHAEAERPWPPENVPP
jgi:acyl-CoA thioesterase FadM